MPDSTQPETGEAAAGWGLRASSTVGPRVLVCAVSGCPGEVPPAVLAPGPGRVQWGVAGSRGTLNQC